MTVARYNIYNALYFNFNKEQLYIFCMAKKAAGDDSEFDFGELSSSDEPCEDVSELTVDRDDDQLIQHEDLDMQVSSGNKCA